MALLLALSYLAYALYQYKQRSLQLQAYVESTYKIERGYIERLSIYSDYINPEKEKQLRSYRLPYHLQAAHARNTSPLANEQEIAQRVAQGSLTALNKKCDPICFFYNVPHKYRYLSAPAAQILEVLGERFQQLLKARQTYPKVKFAVSSALRPVDYQSRLGQRNANAALVSSHSYGESFDVFYDEFYVVLEELFLEEEGRQAALAARLHRRLGFLMGQSLRRQFRAVLTEAILQLQTENKLYAILEKRQRCYHITAR